jgi:hypothetical protein
MTHVTSDQSHALEYGITHHYQDVTSFFLLKSMHKIYMNGTKTFKKQCFMCITSSSNSILQVAMNNLMARSSQNSQHVEMINYKASPRSQCLRLLFNTQPNIIGDNTFTTISQMAQVHKESTQVHNATNC